ncbi:ubiquitin carboxyl-terminal hydrolase 24-like [Brassica napus]|uniref:ubiquitin carboxyl-terminal hydrolase 24-like n=1 Tax=Brassica napus TaxID=3708 RepID=UPI000BBEAB16|nr:ubiquitin carboxyl-terminal hydrolase 24-like [Brassica napus]
MEHETKSLIEHNKPIRSPHNHKEKSVESIQFGSFYLATDNSSVNTNGPLKKGQADGAVKSRPSSSQSAGSQKGLDASTPSTSDKISDTEVNGIIKEVSERKPLTNGVTVKADPIGLGKLCVSDAESDSLYKASSSKFQALEDSEILLSDSSSNSVPRKNNQMVATETPLPVKKELTPRGLINAGNFSSSEYNSKIFQSCYLMGDCSHLRAQAESPTLSAFSEFISELDKQFKFQKQCRRC